MTAPTLGRYRIDQRLGEGGMGVVYLAHDLRLGRPVALKLLNKNLQTVPAAWGQLLAEAQVASSLNHPNICTVYEVGEEDGQGYISMEYVEGQSLNAIVRPTGLSGDAVLRYGTQIAEALEHAHEHGIVHGDVKSANVMVTPQGRVKVLDFGLARRLAPEDLSIASTSRASLNEIGPIAGTLPYLAPEMLRGKPASVRTDLWGLGVILHEMATGESPFTGETAFELSLAIMVDSRVVIPPRVPPALRPVLEHCLEKDPTRRYQHAQEVCEDLRARAASIQGGRIPTVPFHRRMWLAAGSLLLAAAVVLGMKALRDGFTLHTTAAVSRGNVMAVLPERKILTVVPFRVLEDQGSLSYLAEGLTDTLSARLYQVRSLQVIPYAGLKPASGQESLSRLATELGVNLAITGVVQGEGDSVRVIATVQSLPEQRPVWTHEYSGSRKQLLPVEDQVFSGVVSALGLPADAPGIASAEPPPTENADAYDLYLRGRDAIRNFKGAADILSAIGFYQEALKQDPQFVLAYAGMADASLEMYGQKKENFWAEKALDAARQAVRLNPRLAEARFALGSAYSATGRTDDAVAELKRAVEIKPDSDEGYRRLGTALLEAGHRDEALRAYQKAILLSPYYPDNYQMLGDAYLDLGENEKALGAYRRVTELEPDNAAGYESMGAVHFQEGKWNECILEFQKALQLHPGWDTYSNLGLAYFYLKRYQDALQMFEKAVALNPGEAVAQGNLADGYRWSGQKDKAAAAYDRAIELANRQLQVNPRDASALGSLALYYAKTGNAGQATACARRALNLDPADVELIYADAVVKTLAGRPGEAMQSLRRAFLKGYSPRKAVSDPELSSLQSLPQFAKLAQEFAGRAN